VDSSGNLEMNADVRVSCILPCNLELGMGKDYQYRKHTTAENLALFDPRNYDFSETKWNGPSRRCTMQTSDFLSVYSYTQKQSRVSGCARWLIRFRTRPRLVAAEFHCPCRLAPSKRPELEGHISGCNTAQFIYMLPHMESYKGVEHITTN
jgi:hypothetical protein